LLCMDPRPTEVFKDRSD